MSTIEKVCAVVIAAFFGPLLLLILYLVLNQFLHGHGFGTAEMFFIGQGNSTSSW